MSDQSNNQLNLPTGWTVSVGRESVQTNAQGQNLQGLNYTLSNAATGASTTVFIPYNLMNDVSAVSQIFAARIAAIQGVVGLGS